MERAEYLKMCQKVATLQQGVGGIKQSVPDELCVLYKDIKWYPEGYMLIFNEVTGEPIHVAILHDMDANSIKHAKLSNVEVFKNEQE